MPELRTIAVCPHRRVYWHPDAEAPKCEDATHEHPQMQMHRHHDSVQLPDGTTLMAMSFDTIDPYARPHVPAFGLYLDQQWNPPWRHAHLAWPDFGLPDDPIAVIDALRDLHGRAGAGELVELGCHGGHGRTGTALAALGVMCGLSPDRAIEWVRQEYCEEAVETTEQEAFVSELHAHLTS